MSTSEAPEIGKTLQVSTVDVANSTIGETRECDIISPISNAIKSRSFIRSLGPPLMIEHNLISNDSPQSLEYSPSKAAAKLPEDLSGTLFLEGYNSNGLLPNIFDIQEDLLTLEDYINIPVGQEVEDVK